MFEMLGILLVSTVSLVLGGLVGMYIGVAIENKLARWREERNRNAAACAIKRLGEIKTEYAHDPVELRARADGALCGLLLQIGRGDVVDKYERVREL